MPSGQAARRRSDVRKAQAEAIRRGRLMAVPPGITTRFDDDVELEGFKRAQKVHFNVSTGRRSTRRTIAASHVERCLWLSILLGERY